LLKKIGQKESQTIKRQMGLSPDQGIFRIMYELETNGILISVEPDYLDDQSEPNERHFVWAYTVRIDNRSSETVQLTARHWRITNGEGKTEIVHGEGVVGEKPVLHPGEAFEYTSGAPLNTPTGFMSGSYEMKTARGKAFEVTIPAFSLDSPHANLRVH
jgi:ApaG protein